MQIVHKSPEERERSSEAGEGCGYIYRAVLLNYLLDYSHNNSPEDRRREGREREGEIVKRGGKKRERAEGKREERWESKQRKG